MIINCNSLVYSIYLDNFQPLMSSCSNCSMAEYFSEKPRWCRNGVQEVDALDTIMSGFLMLVLLSTYFFNVTYFLRFILKLRSVAHSVYVDYICQFLMYADRLITVSIL